MKISKTYILPFIASLIASHISASTASAAFSAEKAENDSAIHLNEVSVMGIKQGNNLQMQPMAATVIGKSDVENFNIQSIKNASEIAPNFFIPDYGSRITSSIYVRGMGTRIDQPVVGLNIDNIPVMDKNNYDFDIADIDRIEIIRGPQSALFGRNTMGGIINIYTTSPLSFQGYKFMGEYSAGNSYKLSASYYTKVNHDLGLSISGYYTSTDGFFTNRYNGKKCDNERQGSGRFKLQWHPASSVSIDNTFFFSILRQGGYPYEFLESEQISYNDTCFYRRATFNDGLTVNWKQNGMTITSVTSFQYINDNMTLDQDFLPASYFTLTQARKESAITQDLVAKSFRHGAYKWLFGLFAFYKHLNMDAPVTFKDTGIAALIESHRNEANPFYPISWDSREFLLSSNFTNPNYGLAAYHQSEYRLNRWTFTAALRFDFEHTSLDYRSSCSTGFSTIRAQDGAIFSHTDVKIDDSGRLSKSFTQLLPKLSVTYQLPTPSPSSLYFSVAKGYKAGGYNTQMFSDVLQQRIMTVMGMSMNYNVNEIVGYKPEKSWNFEFGSHIECYDRKVISDLALFYIDCTDQQLTVFPDGTTTGRIMTNAGHAQSFGAEYALKLRLVQNMEINMSYGYTNATFKEYDNGKSDYSGKRIPYVPQNTVFASASYSLPIRSEWLNSITFTGNYRGAGSIYWNEDNSVKQSYYGLLSATIRLQHQNYSIDFWGQNLSGTSFKTFYFVSIGNSFLQRGKPRRLGATLRINI